MKYTLEQKEYARQRRNYLARQRYHLKKQGYEGSAYKDIYERIKLDVPIAKEITSTEKLEKINQQIFEGQGKVELIDYIDAYRNAHYNEIYSSSDYEEDYEDNEYDNYVSDYSSQNPYNEESVQTLDDTAFERFFDETEYGSYVFKLTGEIFTSRVEAEYFFISEFDLNDAITEGETIISWIFSVINNLEDLKASDPSVSYMGGEMISDILLPILVENRDALCLKIHNESENIMQLVEVAVRYSTDDSQDRALTELSKLLEVTPDIEKALSDYLNYTKGSTSTSEVYTGDYDSGFTDL